MIKLYFKLQPVLNILIMIVIGFLLKSCQEITIMILFQIIDQYQIDFKILKIINVSIIFDMDKI